MRVQQLTSRSLPPVDASGILRFVAVAVVGAAVAGLGACGSAHEGSASEGSTTNPDADSAAAAACPALTAGTNTGFSAGGQVRSFELLLPPRSFTGARPILFAWHGTSENGSRFIRRAKLSDFADRGFVVIAPDAVGNGQFWPIWDAMRLPSAATAANPDVAIFDRLLSCARSRLEIDSTRVFVAGHSAGGIFVNHLFRNRSEVLAGGIAASGVFDLTGPSDVALGNMLTIVTWGGDNDRWSGSTPSGNQVSNFSFVEQAALATQFYAAQPSVASVTCRGNDVGHRWLNLNNWFIDVMLAHPKGTAADALQLPPVPNGANAVCTRAPYLLPPMPQVTCPAVARAGCTEACQMVADCAVENRTVGGSVLGSALAALGFAGTSCAGCVQQCNAGATTSADANVLACISARAESRTCGGGIEGALPLFETIDHCCEGQAGSQLCQRVCQAMRGSPAADFVPACR